MQDFINKKNLAKLGFSVRIDDVEGWQYEAYCLIASELNRLESEEIEKARKKRG